MNLHVFLNPVRDNETKEIVVSDRFIERDEQGNPILDEKGNTIPFKFKIRALKQEESAALLKAATSRKKDRSGNIVEERDIEKYTRALVVAATVNPDFSNKALCDAFGVLDPLMVPGKMLYVGEYATLSAAIQEICGLDVDEGEEAKN